LLLRRRHRLGTNPEIQQRSSMDPNATWHMLCEYLQALHQHPSDEEIRANVILLFEALTRWLRTGGFPPTIGKEK
jgi:hypothetical protein